MAPMADSRTILSQYLQRTPASARLAEQAREVLPGGIVSDTRFFEPYGIYVDRAQGTRKWDVDGNEYLDLFGGHGANLLGHSPPAVVHAVREQIAIGVQYAANQPLEIALAREIVRLLPGAQRVRFTGSGTEATMLALRLARAYTGRKKIVRFARHYHGWNDHVVSGYSGQFDGGPAPGILAEIAAHTVLLEPNDVPALERAVGELGGEIAAFIIEPVGMHFGILPVSSQFLHQVQETARSVGALFILDEVLSGFRVAPGGAQSIYGLKPDLTALAKILCGGLPGGAVAGRAAVMDVMDFDEKRREGRSRVLHQGTFTANPLSMAAGLAMLREIERTDACTRANRLGALMRELLNEMALAEQLPFCWYGEFSGMHMQFRSARGVPGGAQQGLEILRQPQPLANRFRMAVNVLGADINTRCSGLLSAVHTKGDIALYVDIVAKVAAMLRREGLI
jgi:glutamate-1-semialdehyde 2,1-aminomutase